MKSKKRSATMVGHQKVLHGDNWLVLRGGGRVQGWSGGKTVLMRL